MKEINLRPFLEWPLLLLVSLMYGTILIPKKGQVDTIDVVATKITGNLYMLNCINGYGGGNSTVSIGDDGILMADNMLEGMAPKIEVTLKSITNLPIRVAINSHFHGDHIGNNDFFEKSAMVIAQENVSKRLRSKKNKAKLPHITFKDSLNILFNGEEVQLIHFANCHTDGDAIIYFTTSKVLHMGDLFFFGMFPAVYSEGGGNIVNMIKAIEEICKRFPKDTKVVPGHGELATMKDLTEYLAMLKETTEMVQAEINDGKSVDQIKKLRLPKKYNELGRGGAQTAEEYLAMLYNLISQG